ATGFNRHYPDESNARDLYQRRQDILNDITDTTGAVFLGLTVGCARCHDHKYDDIPQADYYRLQAFFANVRAADEIPAAAPDVVAAYKEKKAAWEEKTKSIREQMAAIEAPKRAAMIADYVDKYPPEVLAALHKSPADRSPLDRVIYYKAAQY